jgi:hypothetical protein
MNQSKNTGNSFVVFCGSKDTMEKISERGARALNPKTMKYQLIDKSAKYSVVKSGHVLYDLVADIDLRRIANEKGLIL